MNENYGYVRNKPLHTSLLDYLGPWPWCIILTLEAMAMLSFAIDYLPFFVMDRFAPAAVAGKASRAIR